jgi:hypothetical protein
MTEFFNGGPHTAYFSKKFSSLSFVSLKKNFMLFWLRLGPTIGVVDLTDLCPFSASSVVDLSGSLATGGRCDFDGLI